MSNSSIKARITDDLRQLEGDASFCVTFAESLDVNIAALESIPLELVHQGRSLAQQVLHSGWALEQDCVPNIEPIVQSIREWLSKLPN